MFRTLEECIHIVPMFEFVLLFILLLKSTKLIGNACASEVYSDDFEIFKAVSITSVVLSVISFLIGNAFMCRTGKYGCTRLVDTKRSMAFRFLNELSMISTCGCIIYLISASNKNENGTLGVLAPLYVLAFALYTPAAMMNTVVLIIHVQKYREEELYVSVGS